MNCPESSCSTKCNTLSSCIIFGLFLILTLGIFVTHLNQSLFITINAWHTLLPTDVWGILNFISYRKFMILPMLLLAVTYVWRREKLFNILLLIISYFLVFGILKHIVHEARPYIVLNPNSFFFFNVFENKELSSYMSFPSGHVGNMAIFAFALNSMFFQNKRFLQFLMLFLVIITAFARICTGWHWPLDVLASGLIGYLLVKICLSIKLFRD